MDSSQCRVCSGRYNVVQALRFVPFDLCMSLTPKGRSPFALKTVDSDIVWC